MKILLIDTCGGFGSVALAETAPVPSLLATKALPGRTASERLLATIRELLADASLPLSALGAIAVIHGPGSFTGVRVGVAAAKGLCEALDLPIVAISRLAVLASMAAQPGLAFALLDAGRGEVYLGKYRGTVVVREVLATRDEVLAEGAPGQIVLCESALLESLAGTSTQLVPEPSPAEALPLAAQRIERGDFDDVITLDANYVRRTDAELFARRPALVP